MSRKNSIQAFILMFCGLFFFKPASYAGNLEIRPRIETGTVNYSFEIGTVSSSLAPHYGQTSGANNTQDKREFTDTMGFVGGGLTLFSGRWFIDLSAQSVLEGKDRTSGMVSQYDEEVQGGFLFAADLEYSGKFDHQGQAVSVGYALNKRLSVFAGYKWAQTDLEMVFEGPLSIRFIDQFTTIGRLYGEENVEFEYAGPFLGITHGWPIDQGRLWNGLISANMGVAFLSSDMQQKQNSTWRLEYKYDDSGDWVYTEPLIVNDHQTAKSKGKTLGITLGLSWNGMTPISGLTYTVGLSGYRYQFDSDDPSQPDIRETTVNLKLGVAYLF